MMASDDIFSLEGKYSIITGGAGTLGRRFALALASRGSNVAVADSNEESLREFEASLPPEIRKKILTVSCDVSNEQSVVDAVGKIQESFGRIDYLVNNAATPPIDPEDFFQEFQNYPLHEWKRVMSINIDGMFLVAKHVGKLLIEQKTGGSIVQTSSIYGAMSSDKRIYEGARYKGYAINNPAVYSASKAAVIGLTRWLATNWAEHGIRVNAVAPGGVESDLNPEFLKRYSQRVPMGRMAKVDEITGTVIYLLSDASSYVTGQCLLVDGGLSAW